MAETLHKDVVVIGSGGAGLTGALAAAQAGLNVLLVEKEPRLGGTLSWSGGGVYLPLSEAAEAAGFEDSREDVLTYMDAIGEGTFDRDLLDAYLESSPELVHMLHSRTDVRLLAYPGIGDWFPEAPGARPMGGRSLQPAEFDGKTMGKLFDRLREPLRVFNAPGGFMIDMPDIPHLSKLPRSLSAIRHMGKLYLRYLLDRARRGRSTRLTMGNALAAGLVKAADDSGVEMWTSASATDLLMDNGRVAGVTVERDGKTVEVKASRGVLLASGGFSANEDMRRKYIPFGDQHYSLLSDSNSGDGLQMGMDAGGEFVDSAFQAGGWNMLSLIPEEDGSFTKFPHLVGDRPKPGYIAVDRHGNRFTNEASLDPVTAMHASGSLPAWLICDHAGMKKYGLGPVRQGGMGLKKYVRDDYIVSAPTLEALAQKLGIDPAGLAATVARNNEFARTGKDLDFGKGDSPGDRGLGDPDHKPNPNIGPIGKAPFYGVRIHPGDAATMLGMRVDRDARVLRDDGSVVNGLYAAGLDMASVFRGRSPGGGANNGPAMLFGYRAGKAMAKGVNHPPDL